MGGGEIKFLFRVFNPISWVSAEDEWDIELNTGREILYLQATTYYFVYHVYKHFTNKKKPCFAKQQGNIKQRNTVRSQL